MAETAITRQRRIAAYRTADAVLVWLTGTKEGA